MDALRRGDARPRGQLVLVDGHPLGTMVTATDPLVLSGPYGGGHRLPYTGGSSYAGVEVRPGPTVEFAYSPGEVVTAAADAGLRIVQLVEHLDVSFDPRSGVVHQERDGRWRLRVDGRPLPTLYTLLAVRPGDRRRSSERRLAAQLRGKQHFP